MHEEHAKGAFYVFAQRLERALKKKKVAVFGVLEHSYSGCGNSPSKRHWHLLVACPGLSPELLKAEVSSLWSSRYGNCVFETFKPGKDAAYYTAKTAGQERFEWEAHNLGLAYPSGCEGIRIMDPENSYIPEHARQMSRGQTLRLRQLDRPTLRQLRNTTGGGDGRHR